MEPSRRHPTRTPPLVTSEASAALRSRLMSTCSNWSGSPCTTRFGPEMTCTWRRVSKLTARPTEAAGRPGEDLLHRHHRRSVEARFELQFFGGLSEEALRRRRQEAFAGAIDEA